MHLNVIKCTGLKVLHDRMVIHHMVINHNRSPYYVHIEVRSNNFLSDGDYLLSKCNPLLFKKARVDLIACQNIMAIS